MDFINNDLLSFILLLCAVFRIYLEVAGFSVSSLPITRALAQSFGPKLMEDWHRLGLYLSIGYLLLFGPAFLMA